MNIPLRTVLHCFRRKCCTLQAEPYKQATIAYGMQIALTVDQAAKAGIIPYTSDLPASFFKAADSQKERVLLDSYSNQKAKIDELKTAKAKATHWNRYLNTLKEYEDQYSMNPDSEYPEVLEQVKGELAKLDLSTSVPPPNP